MSTRQSFNIPEVRLTFIVGFIGIDFVHPDVEDLATIATSQAPMPGAGTTYGIDWEGIDVLPSDDNWDEGNNDGEDDSDSGEGGDSDGVDENSENSRIEQVPSRHSLRLRGGAAGEDDTGAIPDAPSDEWDDEDFSAGVVISTDRRDRIMESINFILSAFHGSHVGFGNDKHVSAAAQLRRSRAPGLREQCVKAWLRIIHPFIINTRAQSAKQRRHSVDWVNGLKPFINDASLFAELNKRRGIAEKGKSETWM